MVLMEDKMIEFLKTDFVVGLLFGSFITIVVIWIFNNFLKRN